MQPCRPKHVWVCTLQLLERLTIESFLSLVACAALSSGREDACSLYSFQVPYAKSLSSVRLGSEEVPASCIRGRGSERARESRVGSGEWARVEHSSETERESAAGRSLAGVLDRCRPWCECKCAGRRTAEDGGRGWWEGEGAVDDTRHTLTSCTLGMSSSSPKTNTLGCSRAWEMRLAQAGPLADLASRQNCCSALVDASSAICNLFGSEQNKKTKKTLLDR